jgi:pimeloyl-ACP methyl ester carboxylesterase
VRSLVLGAPAPGHAELVVVPGLGALDYLLPALQVAAARTTVHLLDLPGFGHPRTARCPSRLADVARAVAAWLRAVPDRPVVLVGHSTGGQAALHAAREVPVAGLVLSGLVFPASARRWLPLAGRVLRTLPSESAGELPRVLPQYLRGGRRLLGLLASSLADRPEDVVGEVDAPVLVVRGRRDALCDRDWAARIAGSARRGTALELPGGHNTPTTAPEATALAWTALLGCGDPRPPPPTA